MAKSQGVGSGGFGLGWDVVLREDGTTSSGEPRQRRREAEFLWGSSRGILVVFEAPGPSNVRVWSSQVVV